MTLKKSSTFSDQKAAEKWVARNITVNRALIEAWLEADPAPKVAFRAPMDPADGTVYLRDSNSFVSAREVVTVLKRKDDGDWFVFTSYPSD